MSDVTPIKIAWFRAGDDPTKDEPAKIVDVNTPGSFYIDPAVFNGWEGNWYQWSLNSPEPDLAFIVRSPKISILTYEPNDPVRASPTEITRYFGTLLNFRLDTNLDILVRERQVTTGFIDILVRDPSGVTYSKLYTSSSNPLVNPKHTDTTINREYSVLLV